MGDKPYTTTADEVVIVRPGEPTPSLTVLPDAPPPGLSPQEMETWLENEEDERLFGENS